MHRTFTISLLLSCLFWQGVSLAQKTEVRGKVTDAVTGEAMPFVNLFFQGTKTGTSSGLEGNFFLSSYYVSDSLTASFIGYEPLSLPVKIDESQTLNFALNPSSIAIEEAVVTLENYVNPAHIILDALIRNKLINNREKLEDYAYEAYNKVEFDIHGIDDDVKDKKIMNNFEFIFDNIDSTGNKDPYLPIFMTESLSEYHYRKNPKAQRETILATNVSGLENNSVSQFLGDMYQSINVYDNNLIVFGKSFVSPFSNYGKTFYYYYLKDSTYIDNKWCYKIDFLPRRKQEALFDGHFWVADTSYAIKEVEAHIVREANVNFINEFDVVQRFDEVEPEVWMLTSESLVVDFRLTENGGGFYGRKNASYRDFKINKGYKAGKLSRITDVVVAEDANLKTDEYWEQHRHVELSQNESDVYAMMDTLQTIPRFKSFVDIVQLAVTGYKVVGKVEIGPYSKLVSFNAVEGTRVRLGVRTSNAFSTRTQLEGYLAYGFRDEKLKYGGSFAHFLDKQPRMQVGLNAFTDIEQLGVPNGAFATDNALGSIFRRSPASKLLRVEHIAPFFEREFFYGLSSRLTVTYRNLLPIGETEFIPNLSSDGQANMAPNQSIKTGTISLYTRFAFKEKYVSGEFDRISLGTRYPTIEVNYARGVKGLFGGQYGFQKIEFRISDKIVLGPFGYLKGSVKAGRIYGNVPFPLMEVHQGNETFFYNSEAFNTMNFFEFVSDRYVSVMGEQHFEGLFFNKVPLFRKLKWREVVSAKMLFGTLKNDANPVLELPSDTFTLDAKPFAECAVGIENIFKVLRVDALWRLSYLDNPDIVKFGIRAKLQIDF